MCKASACESVELDSCSFFFFLSLIVLIHNVLLVSGVQQSDSVWNMCIYVCVRVYLD